MSVTVNEIVRLDGVMLTPTLKGSEFTAKAKVATNNEKEKRILLGERVVCHDS